MFHGLGIPKKFITSYPADRQFHYSDSESIHIVHVADKALITVVVSGVDKAEVEKHGNLIINFLSLETGVKESEIEIVQVCLGIVVYWLFDYQDWQWCRSLLLSLVKK